MKFITAFYNGLHNTEYGGRLNRDRHYLYSMKCLSNMGAEIVCYTSSNDVKVIEDYIKENNITNISIKIFGLSTMRYHKDIQDIKLFNKDIYKQDNVWEHRCVELMWLKLFWLYQESKNDPNEKVMWIDAGLSHGGIIPKKFNSNIDITDYEMSFQNDKAFNLKLIDKLDKLSENKIFTFYCNNRQHNYPELFLSDPRLSGSICAGLFGGKFSEIKLFHDYFVEIIEHIIKNKILMQEEMIMTLIYQVYPDLFSIFDFDTWYHVDWDCFNPNLKSFSEFFEDLL